MTTVRIEGGRVLGPEGLETRDLHLVEGRIVEDAGGAPDAVVDARGLLVLPGAVDLHGDAFERELQPRPGVRFDPALALAEVDRRLIGCGITTAYHALTVGWEPGLRSPEAAAEVVAAIRAARARAAADARLHLRWEVFAEDARARVLDWLAAEAAPILAFNDHLTNLMTGGHMVRKAGANAARAGLTAEAYRALCEGLWARRAETAGWVADMAAAGRAAGATLLAHDEDAPETRARFRALGARASEFPLTRETAEAARAAGEAVILGAPNVLRGGSHNGAISAAEAVEAGLCTVLASDYWHPSLAAAPFALARRGVDFAAAWRLVSEGPAAAAGLADRGRLAPGLRADVLLVDDAGDWPEVVSVRVAGREVLRRRAP